MVRNLDAWYIAFAVKPGEKLTLKPEERLFIWSLTRTEESLKAKLLMIVVSSLLALSACDSKKPASTAEKIKDKVGDALDTRPNEKLRDAAEDLRDGAKAAAKDLKEAVKDATKK